MKKLTLYEQPEPCGMGDHSWYDCPQCSVHYLWKYPEEIAHFAAMLTMDVTHYCMEGEVANNEYGAYGVAIKHWRFKVLEGIRECRFEVGHELVVEKYPDGIRLRNKDLQASRKT